MIAPAPSLSSMRLPAEAEHDLKFAEPWEARAFAIIVELAQAGYFTWGEWVECFSKEVAAAAADEAKGKCALSYYEQWLNAAEKMMISKGVTSAGQLAAKKFAISASVHVMK